MSESMALELNVQQRDLVMEGLRYIRSARRLAFREPLAPPDAKRESELREIAELLAQLDPASRQPAKAQA